MPRALIEHSRMFKMRPTDQETTALERSFVTHSSREEGAREARQSRTGRPRAAGGRGREVQCRPEASLRFLWKEWTRRGGQAEDWLVWIVPAGSGAQGLSWVVWY